MYYTEIGLYWTSSANLYPHFQNKIFLQTLWFSLWDFHAPNELIELENLSHSHLSLSLSLESHRPRADLGWGVQNLFNEQTGRHYTAQSTLIPPWNWPCFGKDCINQTAAQQYLQRTPEESWHSTPWQHKPGLVFVTVSHLYPCSLVPFTNPWQPANQTKMPILEFCISRETLEKGQLICYILFLEHQSRPTQGVTHKRQHFSNFPFRLFQNLQQVSAPVFCFILPNGLFSYPLSPTLDFGELPDMFTPLKKEKASSKRISLNSFLVKQGSENLFHSYTDFIFLGQSLYTWITYQQASWVWWAEKSIF